MNKVTTAIAHPNIALVKYWGKQAGAGNLPATPSLSITLDGFTSTTSINTAVQDSFSINGSATEDTKVNNWLNTLRQHYTIPPLTIESTNNFPTAAGLASSAAGFAALSTAINTHCGLGLATPECSGMARMGSASAARSFYGGFVSLAGDDWHAQQLLPPEQWPLKVVVAVTDSARKKIASSVGMKISAQTSPYFGAWTDATKVDFNNAIKLVANKDFEALGTLAEHSCLKMHALMLSSQPPLLYWNPTTLACIALIQELRTAGTPVFFTIDAGPQVKAVCEPSAADKVESLLSQIAGVEATYQLNLGQGAQVH